ncbi:hypothetical protein COA00_00020, partial [Bacillus cereus]|uniref:hypothetical protein n=1 Tax=Bacillus cereus TaxID=1396 RepID=UPI000C02F50A
TRQTVNQVVIPLINCPPNHPSQTLAVTLYVPHFTVHKGLLATVCLHLAFCCFFVSQKETENNEKEAY